VYGLGFYPDGRPYYAMRLVKGETLQEAIRRLHAAERPGRDVGEQRLALRQLLSQFLAICNAVAYAHSRGVLHRDLKPANAILGRYGETLVLDWGLAKAAGTPESQRDTGELPLRPAAGEVVATEAGTTLGTPAYMSPEQAEGRWDVVGPASDIYGLGATLYTLLTGQPPVGGSDRGELLRKAARGEWRPPRQVKADVPLPLDAVCRKAMAPDPRQRYATALELAADVEHWLADEPVRAWREPRRVRAGRWVRRHKPQVAALAAAGLVALLLGGAGLVWLERQAEQRRRGVEAALDRAAEMQGRAQWAEARAVLTQAEALLSPGGPADLRRRLERARFDLKLVARLDAIQLQRATLVEGRFDTAGADREYAQAFREAELGGLDEDTRVVAARVRTSGARQAVVDALDDWAVSLRRGPQLDWVLVVARQADPDPWRNRARDAKAWTSRAALSRLAQQAPAGRVPSRFVGFLALRLHWLREDAEGLLRSAQRRLPGDFWVNFELGNALYAKKQMAEAIGFYRAALAVRPAAAAVRNNLGVALHDQGKLGEAVAQFRRAISLDPKYPKAHYNLGNGLYGQGQLSEAVAEFRRAISLDPKYALAYNNLGNALRGQGKLDEAVAAYRRAIALDPKNAKAYGNLGIALVAQRKLTGAVAESRRAIALDPKDAQAYFNLGNALREQGKLDKAVAAYRRAIALDGKFAMFHYNLAIALKAQGQLTQAVVEYRRAIQLDPSFAEAHCNLGFALRQLGRVQESLDCYRRGHRLGMRRQGWRYPSGDWVKQAERLAELDKQLPAFLQGKRQPGTTDDCLALAELCGFKQQYATATRFYADALAGQPERAAALAARHRYNAACFAALAGCGRGEDASQLDDKEKARLRTQALGWLRANLAAWQKLLQKAPDQARSAVRRTMEHWQKDPDLAGVRDKAALAKLPEAERNEWAKFWDGVAALLVEAGPGK
jgi:serine/threonine-protein kinase